MSTQSRPEITGTFGVVTSTHWLATATAMRILERGGNAFDAAVTAGLALHVVEPDQNGPGADLPAVLWSTAKRKVEVLCGQGVAPESASINRFKGMGLDRIPGIGHLPAVVPGAFGAWMLLLRDYGTISLREALEPAIEFSHRGFVSTAAVSGQIRSVASFFRTHWPTSAETFLPKNEPPPIGTLLRLPRQGDTFVRILQEAESAGSDRVLQIEAARAAWYEGFVAEAIDRFFRKPVMDTTGQPNAGFLAGDDLARWHPTLESPVSLNYGAYQICKPGPWAQSPVFLQQLALLKELELEDYDPLGPKFVHTVQECAKLAFADRDAFYGDPKFVDVPLDTLLSEQYNRSRIVLLGDSASLEMRPGTILGRAGSFPFYSKLSTEFAHKEMLGFQHEKLAEPDRQVIGERQGDTCHLDIIDQWGNMISATPSGGWLSGSPVVPELGFSVSTRGQSFWLDENHPNGLAPSKRPRTTLSPTLILRRGEPYLVFGTPGADNQDQWALHAFLRHVHFGMNLQESVDAPSFYTNHIASSFYPREWNAGHLAIESGFPQTTIAELDARGHNLEVHHKWGHYNSVTMAAREGNILRASASPRRNQCYAIGR